MKKRTNLRKYITTVMNESTNKKTKYVDKFVYCEYNENPKSIFDVMYYPTNSVSNEHPLEYMAYTIESELNKFL
jgi:hypothetical protein